MTITRRETLKGILSLGAAGVAGPALAKLTGAGKAVRVDDPRAAYPSAAATEEMYRQEFAATYGDKGEHGFAFHCVNCQGNCAWQVWVKDGKVTRENQSASYPQVAPDIPDHNPRGCNKGAQHSQVMYEKDRLLYPMRRTGERGAGQWQRITWDEAVTRVATELYETLLRTGPAGNYVHVGAGLLTETRAASIKRLGTLLGAVRPYIASYVGDMFPGVSVVYGEGNIGSTYDYIYTTDVAVFWGCNPNTSRIPDAHYLWEGKYNGSKIVVITPEFNSTAIHADLWVPVRPGYDGHLALSIVHEIITRKLHKPDFLRQYTDLPFLVRRDTRAMVRLADIDPADAGVNQLSLELFAKDGAKPAHAEAIFLVRDANSGRFAVLPGSEGSPVETLRLKDIDWDLKPELEGAWKIRLKGGETVEVTTVYSLFVEELKSYSPERTQALTGVHPDVVAELAKDLTQAKNALITMGFSVGKSFNGLLSQRAIASLAAITGRLGPTGGLSTENEWNITGLSGLAGFDGRYQHRFASGFVSEFVLGDGFKDYDRHFDEEDVKRATGDGKAAFRSKVEELVARSEGDAGYATGKSHWGAVETFLLFADARFRRNKGGYKEAFLKKAKFIAYGDYRISDFALSADILLPCKSHYEVWDLRVNPGYHRFANIAVPPKGLKPVGEAKSEWEIATLIVEKMEQLARKRHKAAGDDKFLKIPDKSHTQSGHRAMDELVKEFTLGGRLRTDKDAVDYALEHVDQFKPHSVQSMRDQGGFLTLNDKAGKSSPLYKGRPYNSFESNYFLHQRFETLSGRLTFYVDHPLWIAANAHVPTSREPMRPRRFPFLLMTPHARWSIHSTYKTSPLLLRLQRGKPYAMINPKTARARGIKDGEDLRMRNDLGTAVVMAKITPGVPEYAVVMEHGWEPFMYKGKSGHNGLVGDMLNLLEVSDGWGHLKFGTNWDGNQHAYEGTVELEKV